MKTSIFSKIIHLTNYEWWKNGCKLMIRSSDGMAKEKDGEIDTWLRKRMRLAYG